MSKAQTINTIEKIREQNNDSWIELEKLAFPMWGNKHWEIEKNIRIEKNKQKMQMLKFLFVKYPEETKKIFKEITENDRKINELSKELCK
jgi:hypothetical protein